MLVIVLMMSCQKRNEAKPCEFITYTTYDRVYQIKFNGKDSIETTCGCIDFKLEAPYVDKYGHTDMKKFLGSKDFIINPVHLHGSKKLNHEKAGYLIAILNRLNSKVITDTLRGGYKDVGYIYLSLESQKVFCEDVDYEDKDLKMLIDSLIEYSPVFVNTYSLGWFGLENELEVIKKFDHRKNTQWYE